MGSTLCRAATLYKQAPRTSDGRGGYVIGAQVKTACRALVTEYSDYQRLAGGIPASVRSALILGRSIASGATPAAGDTLVIDGEAWGLININSDPVGATFECSARRVPLPAGDTTPTSVTLLSAMPSLIFEAMSTAIFKPATIYSATGKTADGRGGFVIQWVTNSCRALITEYKEALRGIDNIPTRDRKAIILAASVTSKPKPESIITIEGQSWAIVTVDSDPARATYECQATPAQEPSFVKTGSLVATLANFTLVAYGSPKIVSALSITLEDMIAVGLGSPRAIGSVAATLADFNLTAAGTPRIVGSVAATLDDFTLTASGATRLVGSVAATLGDISSEAAGYQRNVGALSVTLDSITAATAGTSKINGALSVALGDLTSTGTGTPKINGALSVALAGVSLVSTGYQRNAGVLSVTLGDLTATAAGTSKINGALSVTLGDISSAAAGYQRNAGALSVALADFTATATGTSKINGALSVTLADFTVTAAGTVGGATSIKADSTTILADNSTIKADAT